MRRVPASLRQGFTLMEIIVVVIIIAIMMGVAFPTMRDMAENNRLRSSVREMMSLMKYARSEAVFNNRTTEIFIDTEKREFWLDLRTPDPKTGKYDPKAPKATMERKRQLEDKIWVKGANVLDQNILDNGVVAVDFFPDGTASPALITLALEKSEEKETNYTIEVFKSTGMVELNEGDLEEVASAKAGMQYPLPDGYNDAYSGITSEDEQ